MRTSLETRSASLLHAAVCVGIVSVGCFYVQSWWQESNQVYPSGWSDQDYNALSQQLGVRPSTRSTPTIKRIGTRFFRFLISMAHWGDPLRPPNSSLSLYCIWWKAMIGNDRHSSVHRQAKLQYDLLPGWSRWIVSSWLLPLYPRWLHANVELRMAYIEKALTTILQQRAKKSLKVRLIVFGCGYETRSVYYLSKRLVDEAWDVDLPSVIESKKRLLESTRFQSRQDKSALPMMKLYDLNSLDQVEALWQEIEASTEPQMMNILVVEALLLYLDPEAAGRLLQAPAQEAYYLVFADRLLTKRNVREKEPVEEYLSAKGWKLLDFMAKPGATQHLGWARTSYDQQKHLNS